MKNHITVGSRGSRLALIQAKSVVTQLAGLYPDTEFVITRITTRGFIRRWNILSSRPYYKSNYDYIDDYNYYKQQSKDTTR